MLGLGKLARLVRWLAQYRKYLTTMAMTLCLALAADAVANDAVYNWMSIGLAFLGNGVLIPATLFTMMPHLPKSTKLLCCLFGGVLSIFTNIQVSESWAVKYDLMNRMPFEASSVQIEGVRQLYLIATLSKFISGMFALDFFCTCLKSQTKPTPDPQSKYTRRPFDAVSYMRIQQLRDFKR